MVTLDDPSALNNLDLLHDPAFNKGTAFTDDEREILGLRGLLPPHITTMSEQVQRVMQTVREKPTDLEKHIFLIGLQERNRTLFYRILIDYLEELMPLVYTPTVGRACEQYGHIFRRPQGLFISEQDRGRVDDVLANWPRRDVRVIVVTDGERILGLGDLGANGMGIPVGKLSLYTACAGIDPANTLPVTIDVGTNNKKNLDDPLYIGLRQPRTRGAAYDALIDEFVQAVKARFPNALLQFEDFGNQNAFRFLRRYRPQLATFNDDIQGTAAVTLAGVLSGLRVTKQPLGEQTILFLGAGEAGIGIGELIVSAMVADGTPEAAARQKLWFMDSTGLVVASRDNLADHKQAFAHEADFVPDLLSAVQMLRPTVLIGASGVPQTFTQDVIETMAAYNERPMIFALSNPTANSECTARQAYNWSEGRAIFASGSPFPVHSYNGQTFQPGQANNAYVFPGIGLGVLVSEAVRVTDSMFMAAAQTLAQLVGDDDLATGRMYPPLTRIRTISAHIAAAVARTADREGLARATLPDNLIETIRREMYEPVYQDYV